MRLNNPNLTNILGVYIDNYSREELLGKIRAYLGSKNQYFAVTPNPEIILEARRDEEYFYILNQADLAIPDGMGLKIAGWFMGMNIQRMTGADLVLDLLDLAEKEKKCVGIMNWSKGLSRGTDIEKAIKAKYPQLDFFVDDIERVWRMPFYVNLNKKKPDILLLTLGAPWQEKFIYHELEKMPYIRFAVGIGGALDFMTGRIKRAPKAIRRIGFEWLWRLYKQPKRLKRIYRAVVVFSWSFFKWHFIYRFFYRPNVVCLLYKQAGGKCKVLIVERTYEPGHWQLPQGGTDGEDLVEAGLREMKEELGTTRLKPVESYRKLWQYDFNDKPSKFGPKARNIWGYKGQKQGLLIAEFLGKDSDIKINPWEHRAWKWVDSEELAASVHPTRQTQTMIFQEKLNRIKDKT